MKHILRYLPLALLVMTLAACRSSRHAQKKGGETTVVVTPGGTDSGTLTPGPAREKTNVQALSGKLNLKLQMGKQNVKLGGTYRLKRDRVVQLNLVYNVLFVPMNVGTLEITPEGILVLDRINKRYCRARFADIPAWQRQGIDFPTLQAVFWGEAEERTKGTLQYRYAEWAPLSSGHFPMRTELTVNTGKNELQASFGIENLRETDDWEDTTAVGPQYTPVSLDTVMKALMSAAAGM